MIGENNRHEQFSEIATYESPEWYRSMRTLGSCLQKNNVRRILFVHGTFAGNDPLGIARLLQEKATLPSFAKTWKEASSKTLEYLSSDLGNYTEATVSNLASGLGGNIPCERFTWNSGNDHYSRLAGLCELVRHLADLIRSGLLSANDRLIMLGHSHAGQIFALLTSFVSGNTAAAEIMLELSHYQPQKAASLNRDLQLIDELQYDFAIFGTPARYFWCPKYDYRLISVINHRGPVRLSGLLTTRDGDYIQHFGNHGSDLYSLSHSKLNHRLDRLLGTGIDSKLFWKKRENTRRDFPKDHFGKLIGHRFLVDYKDGNQSCLKSLLGHGIYTKPHVMLYNFHLICKQFYGS